MINVLIVESILGVKSAISNRSIMGSNAAIEVSTIPYATSAIIPLNDPLSNLIF